MFLLNFLASKKINLSCPNPSNAQIIFCGFMISNNFISCFEILKLNLVCLSKSEILVLVIICLNILLLVFFFNFINMKITWN